MPFFIKSADFESHINPLDSNNDYNVYDYMVKFEKILRPMNYGYPNEKRDLAKLTGQFDPDNQTSYSSSIGWTKPSYLSHTQSNIPRPPGKKPAPTNKCSKPDTICFYDKDKSFYQLSNFYPSPFFINGTRYPTVEHYYQSQKFAGIDKEKENDIIQSKSALDAFIKGRQGIPRSNWALDRVKVMETALIHKFEQNPALRKVLLSTGNKILVERSPYDSFWGDGPYGNGLNMLGKLLMKVRKYFRDQSLGL